MISTWPRYGYAITKFSKKCGRALALKSHLCPRPLPPSSPPLPSYLPRSVQPWMYAYNPLTLAKHALIVRIQPAFVQNLHALLVQSTSNDTVQLKAVSNHL